MENTKRVGGEFEKGLVSQMNSFSVKDKTWQKVAHVLGLDGLPTT
jgi:hypothetical protein